VKKTVLTAREIRRLETRYAALVEKLGTLQEISQGSVMPQAPRAWRWTRKVTGKTVSLGLTPAQAHRMKAAIANHRTLEKIIIEMREITQKLILGTPETSPTSPKQSPPKRPLS
jgi:hypothetical protein